MRRPPINVFSLSFLDLFSCALASVIVLLLIFIAMMEGRRSDRRSLIFTARVSVRSTVGAASATPSARLFSSQVFDPADFVDIYLADPNGFEKRLEQNSDSTGSYVTYTSRRPAFGRWSMKLRAKDAATDTATTGASTFDIPASIEPWKDDYAEFLDSRRQTTPLEEGVSLALADLRFDGIQNREYNLWRILIRLNDLVENVGNSSSVQRWLKDLTRSSSLRFPYDDRSPQRLRRPYWLSDEANPVVHALAAAVYDRLLALIHGDPTQRSRRSQGEREMALAMMGYHFNRVMAQASIDELPGSINALTTECRIADALRPWDFNQVTAARDLRTMLSGRPFVVNDGVNETTYRFDRSELVVLDVSDETNPTEVILRRGVYEEFVALTDDRSVAIRPADIIGAPPAPLFSAADPVTLQLRMEAALQALVDSGRDTDTSVVPALFAYEYLVTDGPSAQRLRELLESTINSDEGRRLTQLHLAGTEVPGLFLESRTEALARQKTTVTVSDVFVHWGSSILRLPAVDPEVTTLVANEPILEYEIYPDEILEVKEGAHQ